MARPVNANAEQTKRRIVLAASELFAAYGYAGTSVRQIAGSAAVSLGMIRHYFGSKRGLYRACIGTAFEIFDQLEEQISQGFAGGGDPADIVEAAVRRGFRFASTNRDICKLVLWDMMQRDQWRTDFTDSDMIPFLLRTADTLSGHLGREPATLALTTRTLIFLVVRYATADHDEVAFLLAGGDDSAKASDRTVAALEAHLVEVAIRLYT